ncbi:hypothetical protein ACTXN4_23085 [Pseudomonas helleri]|uniref:hypothetical protein n=1 Tax=Pseudomonas helleri TaxID=1608996 RepID=UPI003FD56F5D
MAKLKSSTLAEFSEKMVKYQKLPYGTEIRLYRKKTDRRVRSDLILKRKVISQKYIDKFEGSENVKSFLDAARSLLSTEIETRGMEMRLYDPEGSRLNGNTLISTVRDLDDKDSDDSGKIIYLLNEVLESCGIEDCTLRQVGSLREMINKIIETPLDPFLLRHEEEILSSNF